MPEVGEGEVRLASYNALDLGLTDAFDVGQGQSDAVSPPIGKVVDNLPLNGSALTQASANPFHPVALARGVDVQPEDRDTQVACVVQDQPFGVHTRVVGEHAGQEGRRIVSLEPCRLVGGQCERCRMCLAEPEGCERFENLPDPLDRGRIIASGRRCRPPPGFDIQLTLGGAECPAHLVCLGQGDAGSLGNDLEHLFVEDHDTLGFLQRWFKAGVEVFRRTPVLTGQQERGDHVGLDRARTKQRNVDDEVLEGLRPELADQLTLTRTLNLKAPQRVRGPDQPERPVIFQSDLRPVVEVDADAIDPSYLIYSVCHRGLHADAEDVELEQAQGLDIVLVELAHREPQPAGLDRSAVQQPVVGQDHATWMHGDVPGQTVESLHEVEEDTQARSAQATGAQLGQFGQCASDITGPNVRKRLGDDADLTGRQPERRAHVPDRMARPVGVHHRHTGDSVPAEAFQDVLVDLGSSG